MQHADFLNDTHGRHCNWRLTNWSSAVRIALGGKALVLFRSSFVALLAPTVLLAAYAVYSNRPAFCILAILSLWGFWTSSTGPTGIGMVASTITAIVGVVFSVIMHDALLALSSVLPGITWLGSCAILGTTAEYVIDAAKSSEATFQTLVRRGILIAESKARQSRPLEPASGPDSSVKSPPPAQ